MTMLAKHAQQFVLDLTLLMNVPQMRDFNCTKSTETPQRSADGT